MHRSSPAMLYAVAFVLVFCACSDAPTPKVLVIGLDGIHVGVLATTSTPNIDSLAAAGAFSNLFRTAAAAAQALFFLPFFAVRNS